MDHFFGLRIQHVIQMFVIFRWQVSSSQQQHLNSSSFLLILTPQLSLSSPDVEIPYVLHDDVMLFTTYQKPVAQHVSRSYDADWLLPVEWAINDQWLNYVKKWMGVGWRNEGKMKQSGKTNRLKERETSLSDDLENVNLRIRKTAWHVLGLWGSIIFNHATEH